MKSEENHFHNHVAWRGYKSGFIKPLIMVEKNISEQSSSNYLQTFGAKTMHSGRTELIRCCDNAPGFPGHSLRHESCV